MAKTGVNALNINILYYKNMIVDIPQKVINNWVKLDIQMCKRRELIQSASDVTA